MRVTVGDVMTRNVFTIDPNTPFKEIVRLLEERRIGALPVTDGAGRVVGIVSETDLLLKEEHPEASSGRPEGQRARTNREKSAGTVASDVMTAPVVVTGPFTTVPEAARIMHAGRVKHLPVTDSDGRLVGIISRADLLKVFLRPDAVIARETRRLIGTLPGIHDLQVQVWEGQVLIEGRAERKTQAWLAASLARGVDGVVSVDNRMTFDVDDRPREGLAMWVP